MEQPRWKRAIEWNTMLAFWEEFDINMKRWKDYCEHPDIAEYVKEPIQPLYARPDPTKKEEYLNR